MQNEDDEMPDEYVRDYSKAKPNQFAAKYHQTQTAVVLDSDVAENFPNAESVNEALRSLIRVSPIEKPELHSK